MERRTATNPPVPATVEGVVLVQGMELSTPDQASSPPDNINTSTHIVILKVLAVLGLVLLSIGVLEAEALPLDPDHYSYKAFPGPSAPPASFECRSLTEAVFRDIHDDDYKQVSWDHATGVLRIKPYNNTESWTITANAFGADCSTMVDFNVPGKPNPPPVSLKLKIGHTACAPPFKGALPPGALPLAAETHPTTMGVFSDPSGKLAPKHMPLNIWYHYDPKMPNGSPSDFCT